ncbi:DNA-directed RNA polymerase subunit L [Candidatus Tiddalikarchaeum anstoanum]|nr:DNA-directed RNA polymerase subunit L [Candidatus Tiddalikarchaeum anstoanum]
MKVEVVKSDDEFLEVKFDEDAHTILNLIKRKLLDNKKVTFAGYNKPHPLINDSTLIIRTKGENPKTVLKEAVKELQEELKSLML